MEREQVLNLHNDEYAEKYDQKFLLNPFGNAAIEFEIRLIGQLVDSSTKWLDLACGTGFVLSRFPGIQRAGIDLSPSMLRKARQANPDALFLVEGDLVQHIPAWQAQWSLVSCMWVPYCYLSSMGEFERFLRSAVSYTAPGGCLFIPTLDLEDLRPHTVLPYEFDAGPHGGKTILTGSSWSWVEADGRNVCVNLLAPETSHFLRLLEKDFETLEVVRYPPFRPGWVSRKAVLARGRRSSHSGKARTILHQVPPPTEHDGDELSRAPVRALLAELKARVKRKVASWF